MVAIGNWLFQNCSTVGQGDLVLTDPLESFAEFKSQIPAGEVYYSIQEEENRELGIGTFDGNNIIQRTQIVATLYKGVYIEDNPNPIILTGQSVVACTVNGAEYALMVEHYQDTENPHNTTADQIPYDNTVDYVTTATDVQTALEDHSYSISMNVPTGTGIREGGFLIGVNGESTFDITQGNGVIVDSYTDVSETIITEVSWDQKVNVPLDTLNTIGVMHIFIDINGNVLQYAGNPPNSLSRDYIKIGVISYANGVIIESLNMPQMIRQSSIDVYDAIRNAEMIQGLDLNPVNSMLKIWISSGIFFKPGINWYNDKKDPNTLVLDPVGDPSTPAELFTMFMDSSYIGPDTNDLPKSVNKSGNVLSALTGNKATIHRVYTYGIEAPSRIAVLLVGQNEYTDIDKAIGSIAYDDAHTTFPPELEGFVFLGYVGVSASAIEFGQYAFITNVIGSKGGGNTNTITEDHNKLFNRNIQNQHPISAIGTSGGTQLTDELNRIDIDINALNNIKTDKVNPSTDNAIVRFDGITGNHQDSLATIDDSGLLTTESLHILQNASIDGILTVGSITGYSTSAEASALYAPIVHDHSTSEITDFNTSVSALVTYESLASNFDVGPGSDQVAAGDHLHDGVYSPLGHIHNSADISDFASAVGAITSNYLPLTGGTISGDLTVNGTLFSSEISPAGILDVLGHVVASGDIGGVRVITGVNEIASASWTPVEGSPEGVLTGSPGDLASDVTNGDIYKKKTGIDTNTGWINIDAGDFWNPADNFSMELGGNLTGDRNSYIDFNSDDTNLDFSARIIRTPGVNGELHIGNMGTGGVRLLDNTVVKLATASQGINIFGGITFNNGASVLQDYEEGFFQPAAMIGETTAGSLTYSFNNGYYIRVGNMVTIDIEAVATVNTVPTGPLVVPGLPFPVASQVTGKGAVYPTGDWSQAPRLVWAVNNTTTIRLAARNSIGLPITPTVTTGSIVYRINLVYQTP